MFFFLFLWQVNLVNRDDIRIKINADYFISYSRPSKKNHQLELSLIVALSEKNNCKTKMMILWWNYYLSEKVFEAIMNLTVLLETTL